MGGGERPSTGDDRFRRFMEGLREIDRLEKAPYPEIEPGRCGAGGIDVAADHFPLMPLG
jgi:hypothetical protein